MSKYNELYNKIKKEIIGGQLNEGTKLASVRKAAFIYNVSRTTVQNAYFALAALCFIPQGKAYRGKTAKRLQ